MKKYIALTLAALMLTMPSCGSSDPDAEETEAETGIETAAPTEDTEAETEKPKYERPEDVEVIEYSTLELAEAAAYDRENGMLVLYFTHEKLRYDADTKCSIGLISDEEAISITGTPDLTSYPDVKSTDDFFRGIAIKLDEEIPAGNYIVSITFGEYIVESFEQTIE